MATHKPPCKYGKDCYRRNPNHLQEYSHPPAEGSSTNTGKRLAQDSECDGSKKMRIEDPDIPDGLKGTYFVPLEQSTHRNEAAIETTKFITELDPVFQVELSAKCSRFMYYLSYVHRGIHTSFNEGSALTLYNVINGTDAELEESCTFSYMYDVDWLIKQYKPEFRTKPLTIVEGLSGDSRIELLESRELYPNLKTVQARLDIPFGVHHTKMLLLKYKTGVRVMITTANLIPGDWFQKTQALWCSPLCPPGKDDSITNFRSDLIEYLQAYKSKLLNDWVETLKKYDMSKCRVFLIASVPGRHLGDKKSNFGHLKLRKILGMHSPSNKVSNGSVVCQFSSIGKLGPSPESWLCKEFKESLSASQGPSDTHRNTDIKLVYPTVENVRGSLEGYMAGSSLPFSKHTYDAQRYIRSYMHQWRSESRGRSSASPHIKTYFRSSSDGKYLAWFLMTSSNLSKAAWGALEKQNSQLLIRSYELGVLFIPKFFNLEYFTNDPSYASESAFPLPFDFPLTAYSDSDDPWLVDKKYEVKDSLGEVWPP